MRVRWALLSALTIALGLASRLPGLPDLVHATVGDALYATLCYCLAGVVAPTSSPLRRAAAALTWCFVVEISQAWHPPWLDALRAHRAVALVLGRGFLWSDLACYVVGCGVPVAVELSRSPRRAR